MKDVFHLLKSKARVIENAFFESLDHLKKIMLGEEKMDDGSPKRYLIIISNKVHLKERFT